MIKFRLQIKLLHSQTSKFIVLCINSSECSHLHYLISVTSFKWTSYAVQISLSFTSQIILIIWVLSLLLSHMLIFFCLLSLCTVISVTVSLLIVCMYTNLKKESWFCTIQSLLLLLCRILLSFLISSQFSLWDSSSSFSTVIIMFNMQFWCLLTEMFSSYTIESLLLK